MSWNSTDGRPRTINNIRDWGANLSLKVPVEHMAVGFLSSDDTI
jgi:hypothetical protein